MGGFKELVADSAEVQELLQRIMLKCVCSELKQFFWGCIFEADMGSNFELYANTSRVFVGWLNNNQAEKLFFHTLRIDYNHHRSCVSVHHVDEALDENHCDTLIYRLGGGCLISGYLISRSPCVHPSFPVTQQ